MARPTLGHLDPAFVGMMDEVKALLRYAFVTENRLTMPISAPGSAGMEAVLVNLLEPGDTAIVAVNGVFGGRMREIVTRIGATPIVVEDAWGAPVDPDKVRAAVAAHPEAKLLAFVHAETSTGARSDAATLASIARDAGLLVVVDAVTSLAGVELKVDEWGIDAIYSGSQKCLSCTPGLSPVSLSERAVAAIKARKHKVQSWFLDFDLVMGYWEGAGGRAYHHTAPVNALYGLHESLVMLAEEGLQARWARHAKLHGALAAGLAVLGLGFVVDETHRLPQLNSIWVPEGVEEAPLRRRLLDEHGIEIGAGLGAFAGKVWRIGLMGSSCTERNVAAVLTALGVLLGRDAKGAVDAARAVWSA